MLRQRFSRIGDDAGKELASKISKGAKRAEGDMFGLADAVREVERRTRKTSSAAKGLQGDMFGIGRAAKASGRGLAFSSSHTSSWTRRADGATAASNRLRDRVKGLGYEFGSLSRGIRTSSGGFSGFDGVMARVNRSSQFFRNVLRTIKWPAFIAGLGLSLQGLSALAAGAVAAATALGSLSGLMVALPAAALAGAQALGAFKLATAGVADTVKAAFAAEVKGGTQASDVLRQQRDATERVADAKRNLTDVQGQAKKAQDDLREARESATRQLQDMRLTAEATGTSEKQAALSLREARRELARTLSDPAANGLDVQGAEIAVEQARNDLTSTRVEAKRTREDYRDAQKSGVDGMPEVVAAKEAEADANRAVTDAQRDLRRATGDATAAMKDQGSAATALQEKMSQLPPAGQKFVRFLVSLKPRLDALRASAAKGFLPGAEKGLKGVLRNFGVFRGLIDGTSKSLGRLAAKAGQRLGDAVWGRDLSRLGKLNTRIIDRMGDAGLNLADALRHVLVSAQPFLDWLSESTLQLAKWIAGEAAAGRETGRLGQFFDRTRETMERLGRILKGVGGGLLNVGEAGRSVGNEILGSLGDAAEGWKKWTDSTKGQNRLKAYFEETKPAIFEMGRLIRDVGKSFFELGRQRGVAHLLRLVRTGLLPVLRELVGATTGWASGFLKEFQRLRKQGTGGFDAFVQVLAEHAAEAGVKIAKALVTAFVHADIWGKLAIGGFLFSKFGGVSAFDKFGKSAGRRFATGFLLAVLGTELAKEIKTIIEGHKLGAPKSEKFAMALNEDFDADNAAKIIAPNRVKITSALGTLIFNSATEKVIKAQGRKLQQFVGEIPAQILPEFDRLRSLPQKLKSTFQPLPQIAGKAGADVSRALLPKLDSLSMRGGKKAETFAERVSNSFKGMTDVATEAMEVLGTNVSQMLRMLGGKPPKINLQKALQSLPELPPMQQRQDGGFIVPGTGSGDTFKTMLPVGSFVENRNAVQRLPFQDGGGVSVALEPGERVHFPERVRRIGAKVLRSRNEEAPRFGFQRGGSIGPEPKIAGPMGGLRSIGQMAIKKVYEGAKDFLDKQGSVGGGIANAGPLKEFNRSYPEHTLFNADGRARFSESLVARIASWAGLPGRLFGQVAHGESNFYPGVYGIDPGGTEGLGLWQITTGFNDARIRKFGGRKQMFNPLKNAKAAKEIYDEQGIGAWYGLDFVTGMREGGLVRGAANRLKERFGSLAKLAGGGMVDPAWDPGGEVINGSIAQLVAEYAKRYDIDITAGYDPGGGHASPGHNATGTATDVVPRDGNWDGAFAKGLETLAKLGFEVGYDGSIPGTENWPDHGRGNHAHIEWVGNGTAGDARQRLREYLGGVGGAAAGEGPAAAPKEKIPASYKGAKTGALDLGPKPTTVKEVDRQIARWQKEAPVYRKAKAAAEKNGKAGTAQAIGQNLTKIEERLAALRSLRTQLRLKEVRKNLNKRLSKAFGRFGNYEQTIEGSQLAYEKASQDAEQIVGLEPQSPELPASATDAQREAAEKSYVEQFTSYVNSQERPAYQTVLSRAADWRNNILRAERFGFGKGTPSVTDSENQWEGEVRGVRARIQKIGQFSDAVQERVQKFKRKHKGQALPKWLKQQVAEVEEMRKELPALKLRDTRLSDSVLKARELFFPGGENRLDELPMGKRVQVPLPGSGSLEEKLREVQGIHWPEQHELLSAGEIGGTRIAGRFGGVLWDLQETFEGLGLKISQAANGIGSSGSGEGEDSELVSILREIAEREHKGRLISERLASTFAHFDATHGDMPKFHSGGVTPGPATREFPALLKGHETIRTAEQEVGLISAIQGIAGGGGSGDLLVEVNVLGKIDSDYEDPVEVVLRDPKTKRMVQRTRGGRVTAAGARR
jgi:hypothetical protein